jgi:hypothetical protein
MAANTNPIFTLGANVSFVAVTAANTSSEGGGTVGTTIFLAYTPGSNGDFLESVVWMPTASSAATTTTGTVGRVFLSTVNSGSTTSSNTFLIGEVLLPSVTADSSSAPVYPVELVINRKIPSGMYVLVTNHAAPASNSQWIAVCFGGSY